MRMTFEEAPSSLNTSAAVQFAYDRTIDGVIRLATGNNTQGRVTVVFRGDWAQAMDLSGSNVQGIELVEVA